MSLEEYKAIREEAKEMKFTQGNPYDELVEALRGRCLCCLPD